MLGLCLCEGGEGGEGLKMFLQTDSFKLGTSLNEIAILSAVQISELTN